MFDLKPVTESPPEDPFDSPSENLRSLNNDPLSFFNIKINPRYIVFFLVVLFILIFIVNNYLFIKQDIGIKENDNHFYRSIKYYDKFMMNEDIDLTHIRYPPLVYLTTSVFYVFRGLSAETARLSMVVFGIIFLLSMFGIGYEMGGNFGGFSVMALAAASPHIQYFSRLYFLDFPQTALTALSLYLLLKTDFFRNKKFSILFGIAFALSMLTKWSTIFFMIVPVMWFLIPVIFKSKKSFVTFLLILFPAAFTFAGTKWYVKNVDIPFPALYMKWGLYYLIFAVIPSVFCIISMFIMERKWKNDEDYQKSGRKSVINFGYLSSIFTIIASTWVFWAGFSVKGMLPNYVYRDFRDLSLNAGVMKAFLVSMFNFAPVLILVGIIFYFFRSGNYLRDLVIPVSLIFTSLLMLRVMYDLFRVIIALVIFGAVLGGYWVGRIKKRQIAMALTIFIVSISIISMIFSFTHQNKPGYFQYANSTLDMYKPWQLFCTRSPHTDKVNLAGAIKNLSYVEGEGWKNIIIYSPDNYPDDVCDFFTNAYVGGKRFRSDFCWQGNDPLMSQHISDAVNGRGDNFKSVDDILIFHQASQSPDQMSEKLLSLLFHGIPYEKKVIKINKDWVVTNIKIDRHGILGRRRLRNSAKNEN